MNPQPSPDRPLCPEPHAVGGGLPLAEALVVSLYCAYCRPKLTHSPLHLPLHKQFLYTVPLCWGCFAFLCLPGGPGEVRGQTDTMAPFRGYEATGALASAM